MKAWAEKQKGFTIVELLIVIVVIGILAAITIVAYNGIQNRAKVASAQSSVVNAAKQLEAYKTQNNDIYPSTQAAANVSSALTYNYVASSNSYCVASVSGGVVYSASSANKIPKEGGCAGSVSGAVGWWPLNGNQNDLSGYGINGSATGAGVTAAPGQGNIAGTAYAFAASAGSFIALPTPALSGTSFTLTLWFKTSATGTDQKIVSSGTSSGTHIIQTVSPGVMRTCFNSACSPGSIVRADGTWHLVVVSGSASGVTANIDALGSLEYTSATFSGTIPAGLRIGTDYAGLLPFNGSVDDVRIFNRNLSTEEIQALYAAGAQ